MSVIKKFIKPVAALTLLSALASCGGGGGGTGGETAFSVVPTDWSLQFEKGNLFCEYGDGEALDQTTVTIIGGVPPYRIINSTPNRLAVSVTTLSGKNPSFTVTSLGGCGDKLGVLVLDNNSRSINFTATIKAGAEITAATPATGT